MRYLVHSLEDQPFYFRMGWPCLVAVSITSHMATPGPRRILNINQLSCPVSLRRVKWNSLLQVLPCKFAWLPERLLSMAGIRTQAPAEWVLQLAKMSTEEKSHITPYRAYKKKFCSQMLQIFITSYKIFLFLLKNYYYRKISVHVYMCACIYVCVHIMAHMWR